MKRIRNYSISGSKYFILGVIFLVTVIITFISMKFEQIMPSATTMADATLPTVAMDTEAGTQYNEMCIRDRFGSELDADTKEKLAQGERIREMLKQPQYKPMPVEYQVIIIYAVTKKYVIDIDVDRILDFEQGLFDFIDTKYPQIPESIKETKELTADNEKALIAAIEEFKKTFIQ